MLDHRACFNPNHKTKRVILHVRSQSRQQILTFQRHFGGEIHRHNGHSPAYEIRYRAKALLHILSLVGPWMPLQRSNVEIAFSLKGATPPALLPDTPSYRYLAGAIDAKNSFQTISCNGKRQASFRFTFYSPSEQALLPHGFAIENRHKSTVNPARAFLEQIRPFTLEYEKYRAALYEHKTEPFDESILSHKTAEYYAKTLAESRRQKEARKAAKRQVRIDARLAAKQAAKAARLAAWEEKKRQIAVARTQRLSERASELMLSEEIDAHGEWERWYEDLYSRHYATHKVCRLCKTDLPIEQFDRQLHAIDGRKNECKKCAYERYVKPHLAKLNARQKAWLKANPEKRREMGKREAAKPQAKVRRALRNRLLDFMQSKTESSSELFGCTPTRLVSHLTSLFTDGMSWDNYGEWHIDHIIPCRAFDLTKLEERKRCFHWKNLRPLWGSENSSKADTLPDGRKARDVYSRAA